MFLTLEHPIFFFAKSKVEILKLLINRSETTLAKLFYGLHFFPPFSPSDIENLL